MRGKGNFGFVDLWEDTLEEPGAAVDAFIWSFGLRMKSEYTQEVASFTGAHNWSLIDPRQPPCSLSSGGAPYSPPSCS